MEEQQQLQETTTWQSIQSAVGVLGAEELLNFIIHASTGTLASPGMVEAAIFGGIAAAATGYHVPEWLYRLRVNFPQFEELEPFWLLTHREPGKRSLLDRLLDRFPGDEETSDKSRKASVTRVDEWDEDEIDFDGEEDMPSPRGSSEIFLFSDLLRDGFVPSRERMFLCRTAVGPDLFCNVKEPYHIALAGNTGGGKSSIMRMLMLQLCYARARVLLLNPHYTGYDLENDEDWTPFEPYLVHPPMECRKYEVIEHFLRAAATDLIPKRLDKRANSQPFGKPYFIVIDELPSIVRKIERAPDYMREILEEGRKVGVFLISAAQDFLVKTISPKAGGGSIRECYRTVYYVGGDPTTARTLLDMPANQIPEDELGKGVVMFRGVGSKKASQVYVPYVDNASLYQLLGPSTYKRDTAHVVVEQDLPVYPSENDKQPIKQPVYEPVNKPVEPDYRAAQEAFINGIENDSSRAQIPGRAPVNEDIRKHIRRMVEMKKFAHRDIAKVVGLYGPKYSLYQQVCAEEGIKIDREELG